MGVGVSQGTGLGSPIGSSQPVAGSGGMAIDVFHDPKVTPTWGYVMMDTASTESGERCYDTETCPAVERVAPAVGTAKDQSPDHVTLLTAPLQGACEHQVRRQKGCVATSPGGNGGKSTRGVQ
ncbi:hypothetical protein GCM10018952_54750 [Streptosporangium vulgare]